MTKTMASFPICNTLDSSITYLVIYTVFCICDKYDFTILVSASGADTGY